MVSFLRGRLRGFGFAVKGAFMLLKTEDSIQVQAIITVLMTIAGFYFEITAIEWMLQIFAIGLVISIEGLNTAIEEMANFVHPDFDKKIGAIKDVAAGGVFFAALTAVIIGCFIYFPKL
ncbi:MAG: diacylglycerol kinase [Flavobacteriales bacterium]|jgi:diacylglycerol kinase (ATP)|tara:strand:+ start:181 stop:537 length:357 start_codon:yes stop_codon:yes gene_type:complete